MKEKFILLILIFVVKFITTTVLNSSEEEDFLQDLIHPEVNTSVFKPETFVPFNVTVTIAPTVTVFQDCDCGVHDFPEFPGGINVRNEPNILGFPYVDTNGVATDRNQFPFMVALIYRTKEGSGTHFCGGSLINSRLVLTATHCLSGKKADKTEVWLNERDLLLSTDTDHPTIKLKVRRFIAHPEYQRFMNFNDISLIELLDPVDIRKSYLRPICLPPSERYEPTDYVLKGFTAGWGQTHFNGPKSDHLRHTEVPLIRNKACNEESEPYYRGRVTSHMICAGDLQRGGPDACPGDSGGPLFIRHKERYRIIGIVSWGDRCSEPKKPTVYTRVSKYLRWIRKISSETEGSEECTDEF